MPSEEDAIRELKRLADNIVEQMENGEAPSLSLATRTRSNIEYNEQKNVWVLGDRKSTRSAKTKSGASNLLQMMYVVDFLVNQLEKERSSTLRELYYVSESWDNEYAEFDEQGRSDKAIEDLEVMTGQTREDFHLRPEESGATILGPLEIKEQTRRGEREIHCQEDVGEGGYQIPSNPEAVEFLEHEADFVIAVETGGMRDRLVENGFDDEYNTIVVHLKGQPARATKVMINRLHNELDLPVIVFTDADPWSYRIYASVAYGAIKSAHLSEKLATPEAEYVGIQPTDIEDYDLPTDPLSDSDINALENELDDPRFESEYWQTQIQKQLDLGVKAEQQALASRGLDYVTESYLPERLSEMGVIDEK